MCDTSGSSRYASNKSSKHLISLSRGFSFSYLVSEDLGSALLEEVSVAVTNTPGCFGCTIVADGYRECGQIGQKRD